MTPISVVIITYNEEKNLGRCLESVKEIADDIVVVDSFSTDNTESIAMRHGARFVKHPFDGHIEQKNWAITQAKYPHVLSLDADEAIDEELKQSILAVKQNFSKKGYYMNRLTNYCGHWVRHCGWYPDRKLRLWDSRCGKWGGINPHDKYEMSEGDGVTGHLKGDILHYSYYSIQDHLRQIDYFTTISAQALFNKGKKASFEKRYLSPLAKFIESYFFKLGFLDGRYGYEICRNSAMATRMKYRKLDALWRQQSQ